MATILVVDDRPINRQFFTTLLSYRAHRLLEASNGQEALQLARAECPDLIISDILMPQMDGYEFARQLRADPVIGNTPVIFSTAHYLEQEASALARACGISWILYKPCEPEEVLRTVDAALGLTKPPQMTLSTEEIDREHLRLLTDKLREKVEEVSAIN